MQRGSPLLVKGKAQRQWTGEESIGRRAGNASDHFNIERGEGVNARSKEGETGGWEKTKKSLKSREPGRVDASGSQADIKAHFPLTDSN